MRQQFVYRARGAQDVEDHRAHGMDAAIDRKGVGKLCPWAAEIVPVSGGWHAFESVEDGRVCFDFQLITPRLRSRRRGRSQMLDSVS